METIKELIQSFFGDRSRTQQETLDGLLDLREMLDMLIETLQ